MGEETVLSYRRIPVKEHRRKKENKKSPLSKYQSNNHDKQDSLIDANIHGQNLRRNRVFPCLEVFLPAWLLIINGKIIL